MHSRVLVTKIHLGLAVFFLPFLLILPLSGGLYLLGEKGEVKKTEAFVITAPLPTDKPAWPKFFQTQFREKGIDFDFEMIRESGSDLIFRPSTRIHYSASRSENGLVVYQLKPNLTKRLQELHWGHGPALMKWVQIIFALALILVTLSGVYLAFSSRIHRKTALAALAAGLILVGLALL